MKGNFDKHNASADVAVMWFLAAAFGLVAVVAILVFGIGG